MMETRILGKTGLVVSHLGMGLAEIGELSAAELAQASMVLNLALDHGVTFLDTSACYGNSEELIGRTIAHRRDEYVLATKAGHVTGDYEGEDWTAQTILDSIDRSLRRLRTDYLDIVQLHTCSVATLKKGEVIDALQRARDAGKTRFIGYSGDNEAALWAVESGLFDTLQTSFNLVDQKARLTLFGPAQEREMGIIAKRPIANGVWGARASTSSYADAYFARAQQMAALGPLPDAPDSGIALALKFVAAHEAVDTLIGGTRNPDHLRHNITWLVDQPPLPDRVVEELHRRFELCVRESGDDDWRQLS